MSESYIQHVQAPWPEVLTYIKLLGYNRKKTWSFIQAKYNFIIFIVILLLKYSAV